ncbi:MAG: carboxypeptidase regulatory-like domain-containing protein [Anaerolineales bacterium]|nr:carboxypeptidase regulatory-like domain-containing protein [Anaerolineales bacterium]
MRKPMSLLFCSLVIVVFLAAVWQAGAAPQGVWVKDPANPVLEPGTAGSWDTSGVARNTVIKDGGTYEMWYVGFNASWDMAFGFAKSADGSIWKKWDANPILTVGPVASWDHKTIYDPVVLKNGATYEMWYYATNSSNETAIGHATSSDGIDWDKDPNNPVLTTGSPGSWDSSRIYAPSVIENGGAFVMWYQGYDDEWNVGIGRATSVDGTIWVKDPAYPVLEPGGEGTWDEDYVGRPCVIYDTAAAVYRMWYEGQNEKGEGFGYAYSPDGIVWTKSAMNPILFPGLTGAWDEEGIGFPEVIQDGASYEMWYTSSGEDKNYIGHAEANPGGWITGHVVDGAHNPLVAAQIYALDDALNIISSGVSDADGAYAIVDLPAEEYTLEAVAAGYGREYYQDSFNLTGATTVSVTVPVTTAGIDFVLNVGGGISGTAFGPDASTPLSSVSVMLEPSGGGWSTKAITGEDGSYLIGDLHAGEYNAWAVGPNSYLADIKDSPVTVAPPTTTGNVDFVLQGPTFPLRNIGVTYIYSWTNDVYHPDPIIERWQQTEYIPDYEDNWEITASNVITHGRFWFVDETDYVGLYAWFYSFDDDPSPNNMTLIPTYLTMPFDLMQQPLIEGNSWSGEGANYSQASALVVATDEVIVVNSRVYSPTLHISTTISSANDYQAGQRDTWFVPEVGLVKMIYQHDDGSTTIAELTGGPYRQIYLPLIIRN